MDPLKLKPYSDLVNQLQSFQTQDPTFGRRLNELLSINELLTTLNTARGLEETLDIILLTILGEYGCLKGAIFIKAEDQWRLGIEKGIKKNEIDLSGLPLDSSWNDLSQIICREDGSPPEMAVFWRDDRFHRIIPMKNEEKLVGLICLGKSLLGEAVKEKEMMLVTIADFGGVLIGNNLFRDDLERVNRQLQRQIFQLNTLYEITGSFARCFENEEVFQILSNNLMGQFFISRCAVLAFEETCHVIYCKGLKPIAYKVAAADAVCALDTWKREVLDLREVACERVAAFMREQRLHYALPITSEGQYFGLLLLGARLDRKQLAPADKDFILSLAQQSAVALENVLLQKEAIEKKRMEREFRLAREIQEKLLPKGVPQLLGYEIAAEMRPYDQVGGDFYDFIPQDNGLLSFCLADVSGKSLPASMIMSTAQASLRALNSFAGLSPREVIEKLNLHMCQSTQSNKFVTMFYGVLDPVNHILRYINAGHNRPILVKPDKSILLLDKGGMVVGLFPQAAYMVGSVTLEPGTGILIYTDGLSEVMDAGGEEYGDDRLAHTFVNLMEVDCVEKQKENIIDEIMNFSQNKMVDDMTLLIIRRRKQNE